MRNGYFYSYSPQNLKRRIQIVIIRIRGCKSHVTVPLNKLCVLILDCLLKSNQPYLPY